MTAAATQFVIILAVDGDSGSAIDQAAELLAAARRLFGPEGAEIAVAVFGADPEPPARELSSAGLPVYAVETAGAAGYRREVWAAALAEIQRERGATHLVLRHDSLGLELGPILAARLDAACLTGVDEIGRENGEILYRRPLDHGKLHGWLKSVAPVTVLTVQPGAFPRATVEPAAGGRVVKRAAPNAATAIRPLGVRQAHAADAGLLAAEVIVAAGRGIGRRENLELIRRFAALFPKGAVAGSRPLCDDGWLEYRQQVGQTGATVAPRAYLACGISGSAQHVAGMRESGTIVAINRDPAAPIFQYADVGIVDDLLEFIPAVLAARASAVKNER